MSIKPNRSSLVDRTASLTQPSISKTKTYYPVSTIIQTDYVTSTVVASPIPTAMTPEISSERFAQDEWDHRLHSLLPVILAFAIIGILTVLGSLGYLMYRLYYTHCASPRRRLDAENDAYMGEKGKDNGGSPVSAKLSNIIPWLAIPSPTPMHPTDTEEGYIEFKPQQREPIRFERSDLKRIIDESDDHTLTSSSTRRPSLAPSWLSKLLPSKFATTLNFAGPKRHMSLPILFSSNSKNRQINNLNIPISSTFVPIEKSSLTLVPRSEIWLDPDRRRGVDEVDMWERKNSNAEQKPPAPPPPMWRFPSQSAYPDSPESRERRFSLPSPSARRSNRNEDIRRSSTTTMQETTAGPGFVQPSRTKSESTRYNGEPSSSSPHHEYEEISDPSSKFAITVKLPKSKPPANDVRLVRQALETSKLKNSSSQWLQSTGSRSF